MSTIASRCTSPLHVSTYEVFGSVRLARHLRVKSFLDKVIAAILLLLASPIILAAMIAVRLTSSGPVLFKQICHTTESANAT